MKIDKTIATNSLTKCKWTWAQRVKHRDQVVKSWVTITQGQCKILNSDMKVEKADSDEFFLSTI